MPPARHSGGRLPGRQGSVRQAARLAIARVVVTIVRRPSRTAPTSPRDSPTSRSPAVECTRRGTVERTRATPPHEGGTTRPWCERLPQMRPIRLEAYFQPGEEPNVERMCWIAPDLCDVPLDADVEGHIVRLRFPEPAPTVYNGWIGDKDNPVGLSPTYFSAELDWDLDTSSPDAERDSWQRAVETVRAAATRLTNAIRLARRRVDSLATRRRRLKSLHGMSPTARSLRCHCRSTVRPR